MTDIDKPLLPYPKRGSGLSLIELMIALLISSLLMLGLVSSFKTSSDAQKEIEKAGMLIENGRYAMSVLADDIHHAGFYGFFYETGTPPTTLQDPCETASLTNLHTAMGIPLQGYTAPSISTSIRQWPYYGTWNSTSTCDDKGFFTSANLAPGSDVVVVRRADTQVFTGTPTTGEIYLQANHRTASLLLGNQSAGTVDGNDPGSKTADNQDQSALNLRKYPTVTTAPWADTREYHVHVYFVAPCSIGSGTNGVCTTADDNIRTLKRLELTATGGATTMTLEPLAEGIEYLKLEYGIDNSPTTVNSITNSVGDGIPDSYITSPTAAEWPTVMAVRIYILARSTEATTGYTDAKAYTLGSVGGGTSISAANDPYTRHVFSAEVRPTNVAGRREIPK